MFAGVDVSRLYQVIMRIFKRIVHLLFSEQDDMVVILFSDLSQLGTC